jgi:hypothetical protein
MITFINKTTFGFNYLATKVTNFLILCQELNKNPQISPGASLRVSVIGTPNVFDISNLGILLPSQI